MAAGDGLVSMTPTSIAHSGTSATINADGGVDFSAVTSLSLNGVFTGDHDNYLVVVSITMGTSDFGRLRYRVGGVDATGSNYTTQHINVNGSSVTGGRSSSADDFVYNYLSATAPNGCHIHLYGPALAQPTAGRSVNVDGNSSARIYENANTHSLSTSYDGLTFYQDTNAATGNVHVFGYEE
jgi:hypothetical protein